MMEDTGSLPELRISTATEADLDAVLALYKHLISDDPVLAPEKAKSIFAKIIAQDEPCDFTKALFGNTL